MTKSEIARASHLITVLLFKGGGKNLADRLELKHGTPIAAEKPGGGWCFTAAREAIERALIEEFIVKAKAKKKPKKRGLK